MLGDDPFALAHNRAPSGGGRSGNSSRGSRSGPVGLALAAALSSLSPGSEAATLLAAEGSVIPLKAAKALSLLVQGFVRSNSITNINLAAAAASQHGASLTEAAEDATTDLLPPGLSLMELMMYEALGSSAGTAAGAGSRLADHDGLSRALPRAPRAGVGLVSSGTTADWVQQQPGGGVARASSSGGGGLLVGGAERMMGSRAERWQAALLTGASGSGTSAGGCREAESSLVASSQLPELRQAVRGPARPLSDSSAFALPAAQAQAVRAGPAPQSASSTIAVLAAQTVKVGPPTPSASSTIAVLAAQAQAAHLVNMLSGNQQLLSNIWAVDATIRSSLSTEGGRGPTESDNLSRGSAADAPSSKLLPPCSGGGSQRDSASLRLSTVLSKMRNEAGGLDGDGGGARRQRRRSALASAAGASGSSSVARRLLDRHALLTRGEQAAAASSLDVEVSCDGGAAAAMRSSAPMMWHNTFKVERRPLKPAFCQPSCSVPLFRIPAPADGQDEQSIAEEAAE